jgi:hypothetical protein
VRKPSGVRDRAVVRLERARVEVIRHVLLAHQRSYAALMVSPAAYAGLRIPEEVLALKWRHVRDRTLLVEQRLIEGEIVPGQKVPHFRPRAIDLVAPLRHDLAEHRLLRGRPDGLICPRSDGKPWVRHDHQNWRRRIWHGARKEAGVPLLPPSAEGGRLGASGSAHPGISPGGVPVGVLLTDTTVPSECARRITTPRSG